MRRTSRTVARTAIRRARGPRPTAASGRAPVEARPARARAPLPRAVRDRRTARELRLCLAPDARALRGLPDRVPGEGQHHCWLRRSACTYACNEPWRNCNGGTGSTEGPDADGCETRVDNDVNHCGGCGKVCPSSLTGKNTAGTPPACGGGECRYQCALPRFHDCRNSGGSCPTTRPTRTRTAGFCNSNVTY